MIDYDSVSLRGGRKVNEDFVGGIKLGREGYCFCLADGLGGHGNGDKASKTAVYSMLRYIKKNPSQNLADSFETAQSAVLELQKKTGLGMKTTLTALLISENRVSYGHIGDSRIYFFRGGELISVTKDHSVPQMLVAMGEIKPEDIRFHPDRNRLLSVIGEVWDRPRYSIDATGLELVYGDAFLLCSDGFWEYIVESEMISALKAAKNASEWVDSMRETVEKNSVGADSDNYSAVAVIYGK